MPYILPIDRQFYEPELSQLARRINLTNRKGELTYLVYFLSLNFFKRKENYTRISESIGALIDAAEEIRRRYLNPYEDQKIQENGDI